MANDSLMISDELNKNLQKIDKNVEKLSKSTKNWGTNANIVKKSLQDLGKVGTIAFNGLASGNIDKAIKNIAQIKNFADLTQQSLQNQKGTKTASKEFAKLANDCANLIQMLKKVGGSADFAKFSKGLNTKSSVSNSDSELKRYNKYWADVEKRQQKDAKQELLREQNRDKQAYQSWLARKHKESNEHKRIENEKWNTTKRNIENQNKAFAEQSKQQQAEAKAKKQFWDNERKQRQEENKAWSKDNAQRRKQRQQELKQQELNRNATINAERKQRKIEYANWQKEQQQKPENLIRTSQNAKSINDRANAIENMRKAYRNLDPSVEGNRAKMAQLSKEIARQQNELKKLQGETTKTSNTMRQFAQGLGAYFSVQSISNFVRKMVTVRGEFELQQKSLEVLLKSKTEANKLWDDTVNLAVKSPFQIEQLITYTKQLAAYQIEQDKLHDTTKRLADLSAGLGVDMGRLILAYGQVRTAEYLRATEVRQFTEAGVPLLDSLAKRFTALEGTAVSVAEVMERITKRQVVFADVEAVVNEMTDLGGLFYNMQEEQSKTIKGMISNLKDEISLMFYDLGGSQEGLIKSILKFVRNLIKNWEYFAEALKIIIPLFALWRVSLLKTATIMKPLSFQVQGLAVKMGFLSRAVNGAASAVVGLGKIASSFAPFLIISGISAIYSAIANTGKRLRELRTEFINVDRDNKAEMEEMFNHYTKQAEILNDVTSSEKDKNEALEELKKTLKDILPDQMIELKYIRENAKVNKENAESYKEVQKAMEAYYASKSAEEKRGKIEIRFTEDIDEAIEDLTRELDESVKGLLYSNRWGATATRVDLFYKQALNETVEKIKNGELLPNYNAFTKEFINQLAKKTELNEKEIKGFLDKIKSTTFDASYIGELSAVLKERNQALDLIFFTSEKNWSAYVANQTALTFQPLINNIKETTQELKKLGKEVASGKYSPEDIKKNLEELGKKLPEDIYKEWFVKEKNTLMELSTQGINEYNENAAKTLGAGMERLVQFMESKNYGKEVVEALRKQLMEGLVTLFDAEIPQGFQKNLFEVMGATLGNDRVTKDAIDKLIGDKKLLKDVKALATLYKEANKELKEWKKGGDTANIHAYENVEKIVRLTKPIIAIEEKPEDITYDVAESRVKQVQQGIEKIFKEYGWEDELKEKKSDSKKTESIVPKQIEEIKKAFEEWDKLNDYWDNTLSATRVVDAMTESLGALNVQLGKKDGFLTFNGQIVKTKRKLADLLGSMANKATNQKDRRLFLQAQASLQVEFDQDNAKREFEEVIKEIDDQIAGYELFSEFKDLNVGIDVKELADIFGVETKSLEDIKKGLESQRDELPAGNEEEYKKIVEKINQVEEMQDKERVKRLKEYTKMLEKTMDDNLKVHYDYYKQLGQIEQDREKGEITEDFANALKKQLDQQYKEQKDKIAWENFTGGDYYIQMFEDLENASKTSLSIMLTKLRELKDSLKDLPPDQLKEIVDAIEKIEDEQKNRKGAFAGMGENIKTVFKGLKDRKKLEEDLAKETELRDEQKERFDKASLELGRLKAIPNEKLTDQEKEALKIAQENCDIEKKELNIQNAIVSKREKEIGTIREANKELGEQLELASQIGQSALDITNTLGEAFGADSDIFTSISEIGGGLMNTVSGLGQVIASGGLNPMAWIELAKGLADTVAAIAGASDRSKQREIENLKEHIDSLGKSYEELSEAMDMAYSMDRMSNAYRMAQANIEAQKKAIKEQIELEKEKWNTDKKKVKEYEKQLEELDKQSEDLKQQLIDSMGGITDTNSKARGFVDAWVDAFKETGDGLSGLEQNFDEFFDNLIREQISKQVIGSITQRFADEVNKAIMENGDSGEITDVEWRQLQQLANASKEQMNNAMQMYRQFFEESGAGLSGLQEGIKGITESQADIIASYLNSIRMFVSEKTSYAREIRNILMGINGQPNPMLDELKRVARHTENIRDLLLKVSDPLSNTLKVSIYQ